MLTNTMKTNQGSAVIYIVLLIFIMMTSSAIVLATILSRHIRASENYTATEQAFAAANSSIEELLYQATKGGAVGTIENEDIILYDNGAEVSYIGKGCVVDVSGQRTSRITASGIYKGLVRRIELGGGADACP